MRHWQAITEGVNVMLQAHTEVPFLRQSLTPSSSAFAIIEKTSNKSFQDYSSLRQTSKEARLVRPSITRSTLKSPIMMTGEGKSVAPTFTGSVKTSMDGLILFQACLSGKLHFIPQRPGDKDRGDLIGSGNVFVYEGNASGIKRWTDGVAWSPSHVLGNFSIYRELNRPFPPGEKKLAIKRKHSSRSGVDGPKRGDSARQGNVETPRPTVPLEPPANPGIKPGMPSCEQDKERLFDRFFGRQLRISRPWSRQEYHEHLRQRHLSSHGVILQSRRCKAQFAFTTTPGPSPSTHLY
jgi:hypothetical protein